MRKVYINEIIRVNYKCNWSCKFCNVLKTNNYGSKDVTYKEVVSQILHLYKKYSLEQRQSLILSFSGGEPTLNKYLVEYIQIAKKIGVGTIQIQTNGVLLFKNKKLVNILIDAGLDEVFLAQHSGLQEVNDDLGVKYNIEDFKKWVIYMKENNLHKKVSISFNIVVTKINLYFICDYIHFLGEIGFIDLISPENSGKHKGDRKISFGLVQPNGYAELNMDEVLLCYDNRETLEVIKIVDLCKQKRILPDFLFTSPPLCVLNYPEYNQEYNTLKEIPDDKRKGILDGGNHDSYKNIGKEKKKVNICKTCPNNDYCLGFHENWLSYVGSDYVEKKAQSYIHSRIKDIVCYFDKKIGHKHEKFIESNSGKIIIYFESTVVILLFNHDIVRLKKNISILEKFYNIPKIYESGYFSSGIYYLVQEKIKSGNDFNSQNIIKDLVESSGKSRNKISELVGKTVLTLASIEVIISQGTRTLGDFIILFLLRIKELNIVTDIKSLDELLYEVHKNKNMFDEECIYLVHGDIDQSNIASKDGKIYYFDYDSAGYFDYYYDIAKLYSKGLFDHTYFIDISESRLKLNVKLLQLIANLKFD